jgi:hypothetical protein
LLGFFVGGLLIGGMKLPATLITAGLIDVYILALVSPATLDHGLVAHDLLQVFFRAAGLEYY